MLSVAREFYRLPYCVYTADAIETLYGVFFSFVHYLHLKHIWSVLIFFVKFWSNYIFLAVFVFLCKTYDEIQSRDNGDAESNYRNWGWKWRRSRRNGEADVSKMRYRSGCVRLRRNRNRRENVKKEAYACSFRVNSLTLHPLIAHILSAGKSLWN